MRCLLGLPYLLPTSVEYAEVESKVGEQALDHESLLGSPIAGITPATSQPGSLPGVLPTQW